MKTVPGWPRISTALYYRDPLAAIDWLERAFGFTVQMKIVHEGKLAHSELRFGDGLVMAAGAGDAHARARDYARSPEDIGGGNTQNMFVYVDDVEAHHARAVAAGARVVEALKDVDYGADHWQDRMYQVMDPEGHRWWFAQRLRSAPLLS